MLLSEMTMKPVMVITYMAQLAQWKLETFTALKKTELIFKLNEEFVDITPDGRRTISIVTIQGNVMKHMQKAEEDRGEKSTKIIRTFGVDEMRCELKVTTPCQGSDIICTRTYQRVGDKHEYHEED